MPTELTDQQIALVEAPGNSFTEACPGAGKTRAIVVRYLQRTAEEPRKGIALVSFTTGAVDEVRDRIGKQGGRLTAPNYVGTFDAFINRFITRPQYVREYSKTPRFMDTWLSIDLATFRIPDMDKLPSCQLDWFEFDGLLRASLREERLSDKELRTLTPFLATRSAELVGQATWRCRKLVATGILSCEASRALATRYLNRPATAREFGTLLAARFSEVIIDEAQDCGPAELLVLEMLRQNGVRVVAVADPDQSIFEFRRAVPADVRAFAASLGTQLTLSRNHRSSPAISALNSSLRHGDRPETSYGDNASILTPIQVLNFRELAEIAPVVETLLDQHHIPRGEAIFLSHKGTDARSAARSPLRDPARNSNLVSGIAWASAILRPDSAHAYQRRQAIQLIERALRTIAGSDEPADTMLDDRWLRGTAQRLAISLDPTTDSAKTFAHQLRQYVTAIPWPPGFTPPTDLGKLLKAPPQDQWPTPAADGPKPFASTTIHSVKGREFPAVVVVLPQKLRRDSSGGDVLQHWEQGKASEARRVLYVGVSRAQQLLILAVHADHAERVTARLKDDQVPFELAWPERLLPADTLFD
jgi:superfamily I DNA/RNA helicase